MRVVLADKRCENGHFIDESWDLCPYCPPKKKTSEIPIIAPSLSVAASDTRAVALPLTSRVDAAPERERKSSALSEISPLPTRTISAPRPEVALPEASRFVVGWLVGLDGEARGESFVIRSGRNALGRDRKSDITITDDQVSAHHADLVFRPEENRYILMDHNSTNGTFVNEMEIEPRRNLNDRDIVRVGTHRFVFIALCGEKFDWESQALR